MKWISTPKLFAYCRFGDILSIKRAKLVIMELGSELGDACEERAKGPSIRVKRREDKEGAREVKR